MLTCHPYIFFNEISVQIDHETREETPQVSISVPQVERTRLTRKEGDELVQSGGLMEGAV